MPSPPYKPNSATVWMALLSFFAVGAGLIGKGIQMNSLGAKAVGAMLVAAGIYYSIQWFVALWRCRKK